LAPQRPEAAPEPHLSRTFKVSRDPRFEDKLLDVVGLYLNPPEHALVLSCDEKSQIQALNRTQPRFADEDWTGRHLHPRLQAPRHDHAVRGAEHHQRARDLDVPAAAPPHRVAEVPAPDRPQDAQAPGAASGRGQLRHAQPSGRAGLAGQAPALRHALHADRRVVAEHGRTLLRDITDKRIRRDSFTSVAELELAIDLYVAHHNIDPKPFIWTASATDILAKVTRAKAALAAGAE
jgi:hypothetical protein